MQRSYVRQCQRVWQRLCRSCLTAGTAVLLAVACASTPVTPDRPPTPTSMPTATSTPETPPTSTPQVQDEAPSPVSTPAPLFAPNVRSPVGANARDRLIQRAIAELSRELGIQPDAVTPVSSERVDWSDASLGCPRPGMMYAQVITPGFEIVLEAQGRRYRFHTTMNPEGPLVRCD